MPLLDGKITSHTQTSEQDTDLCGGQTRTRLLIRHLMSAWQNKITHYQKHTLKYYKYF